jgi:hypothetical protein
MAVKARFFVQSVKMNGMQGNPEYRQWEVSMLPAYGPGNESWAKATPGGSITLVIDNPDAAQQFKPGQYVDLMMQAEG